MISNSKSQAPNPKYLYRTIWRWHFYAGIFCIPFVIVLALTGVIYLFKPYYEHWQESEYRGLPISGEAMAPNQQIQIALNAIPNGKFLSYRLAESADEAVAINVQADTVWQLFINPYTGEILGKQNKDLMLMNLVKTFHGELLLGNVGSIFVELAACWGIVLIFTGLYLWWPRNAQGLAGVLYPRLSQGGRVFWRDIHAVIGIWISMLALFLLITGLPWALVWGAALKEVRSFEIASVQQDWSQGRAHEHQSWRAQATNSFNLTPEILSAAINLNLAAPVEISIANAQKNSWKVSSQTQNRPLRVDVWLASDASIEKRTHFSEKPVLDRAIGIGIAAHEGYLFGWLNLVLGVLTCLGLILLNVSGFVLWRKRKPESSLGAPPSLPTRMGLMVAMITIGLAIFLPLLAVSLVVIFVFEKTLLRWNKKAADWLGLV